MAERARRVTTQHVSAAPPADDVCAVVRVTGDLDIAAGPDLRTALVDAVNGGAARVVVDLGDVPFIDSTGLGVLVTGLKRARIAGGTLGLAGCRPQVRALLNLTALDRVFATYPDVQAALAGLGDQPDPTVA